MIGGRSWWRDFTKEETRRFNWSFGYYLFLVFNL